ARRPTRPQSPLRPRSGWGRRSWAAGARAAPRAPAAWRRGVAASRRWQRSAAMQHCHAIRCVDDALGDATARWLRDGGAIAQALLQVGAAVVETVTERGVGKTEAVAVTGIGARAGGHHALAGVLAFRVRRVPAATRSADHERKQQNRFDQSL